MIGEFYRRELEAQDNVTHILEIRQILSIELIFDFVSKCDGNKVHTAGGQSVILTYE